MTVTVDLTGRLNFPGVFRYYLQTYYLVSVLPMTVQVPRSAYSDTILIVTVHTGILSCP